jgi:cancer susceptibility candidate protein 1
VQRADEFADPKGDVLLTAQQGALQWGLWVNTQKNPRFKLIELSGLGMSIEIPKQLALANIAVFVQVGAEG